MKESSDQLGRSDMSVAWLVDNSLSAGWDSGLFDCSPSVALSSSLELAIELESHFALSVSDWGAAEGSYDSEDSLGGVV